MPVDPKNVLQARTNRSGVLAAAVLVLLLGTAGRAWALAGSWFYTDDHRLVRDAQATSALRDLLEPFDSQFMPLGRALAWVVSTASPDRWPLAATTTVLMHLLASVACLAMLLVLVGARWRVVVLLAVYETSAVTLPATMWWAAALNQLPLQAVLMGSVATWVLHLRTGRLRWLAATVALVALGLTAYVKAVLVPLVLAAVLLGWFTEGGPWRRVRSALRERWQAAVVFGTLGTAFSAYYVTQVPQVFVETGRTVADDLARSMLLTTLPTGLLGGPWRWNTDNPPTSYADPPIAAVVATWVVLAALALLLALRRRGTGRAWALLGGYAAIAFVLVLGSRAQVAGGVIGLEYRYLTDVLPVALLALVLATTRVEGAVGSSEARRTRRHLPPRTWSGATAVLVVAVVAGGVLSSVTYVRTWHEDNPGEDYLRTARDSLAGRGSLDLADQVVPAEVVPGYQFPANTTLLLLPLQVEGLRFPEVTEDLVVLDDDGRARRADIDVAVDAPPGPEADCGWRIGSSPVTIDLDGTAFDSTWWVHLGFAAASDDTLEVTVDGTTTRIGVRQGPGEVFWRTEAEIGQVTLGGLRGGNSLCVDLVEVGEAVPGDLL
ncbi:hypothetical protein I601_3659 [Nocardioides dokdonensis FR1436]|uniref:Glycosyltransferase RgtA/B/C/D-like domain-containing protein n=1 Tax=Nocardioides dokdonensis FR1436 TaxID=1300347 RepID=A0A1A9GRI5_9ACTN|nr:hypothetical protein [Nocardioides dokdonensis]ANH40065.1 hypothetical protein I601_3659 [Nocardioides dokdonensis FR1436]